MKDLIMQGLTALVQIIVLIVAGYVLKFLAAKVGAVNLGKYKEFAKIAVTAVEQVLGAGTGEMKKRAAEEFLSNKLGGALSVNDIDKLIEAAVFEMNIAYKEATKTVIAVVPVVPVVPVP